MSRRLFIKYRNQIANTERTILEQTFLDIPCGTEYEKRLYTEIVSKYMEDNEWLQLVTLAHHKRTNRLMHSMHVSYLCFLQAYRMNWDYKSAAIGGLLHDFVLFSKKDYRVTRWGEIWCFHHPKEALKMATSKYHLNERTKDIIRKHMFPVAGSFPKYKETYLIVYWDKYCAVREYFHRPKEVVVC